MHYDLKHEDAILLSYNIRGRLLRELSSIHAGLKLYNIGILFLEPRSSMPWWFCPTQDGPRISGAIHKNDIESICLSAYEFGGPPLECIAARITASIYASIRHWMDTTRHEA